MNFRKNIRRTIEGKLRERRGSYITEAAIFLPVFILSVCAIILVIRIIGVCENICFITAEEVLKADLEIYKITNSVSLCNEIEDRVFDETSVDFKIKRLRYLYDGGDMTDLISVEGGAELSVKNAVGINAKIDFTEKLLTRAFTGVITPGKRLGEEEFHQGSGSCQVIVFPKYGMRYHSKACRYVKRIDDTECKKVMEKEDAKRQGYTPCKTCGGAANV